MPPRSLLLSAVLVSGGALAGLVISGGGGEQRPTFAAGVDPALAGVGADPDQSAGNILPRPRVPASVPSDDEPVATESSLYVRVVASDRFRHGRPVPGLAVEAGLGHPAVERVAPLAAGTTDEGGIVELEIPWSVVAGYRADLVGRGFAWARPSELGWMGVAVAEGLPDAPGTVEIRLVPRPGVTLRGRLVAENGTPVAGSVTAYGVTARGPTQRLALADAARGFELHLEAEGGYDLVAEGPACATRDGGPTAYAASGTLSDLSVDATSAAHELEIRLAGSGVLCGRVVTSDGRPVAGVDLDVESVHLVADQQESSFREPLQGPDPLLLEGVGGVRALVRTGSDGEFEVRGLRPGLFGVSAALTGQPLITDRDARTAAPVPCDGTPLVLIFPGSRLLVRVVDEDGHPWDRTPDSLDGRRAIGGRWPAEPRIVVGQEAGPSAAGGWWAGASTALLPGNPAADDSLAFDVAPGGVYAVGLVGGPYAWRPERVTVPAGGGQVAVALEPVRVPFGTLTLSVSDADGEVRRGFEVLIEDPETGQALVHCEGGRNDEWPLAFEVPEGAYRVRVEGRPSLDLFRGTLISPSRHGCFELEVQVDAARTLPVQARLPAGARIDLVLRGSVQAADGEALERARPEIEDAVRDELAGHAEVRLLADQRWPHPVPFRYEITGNSAQGTHLRSALPLGTRQVSETVPAGRFVLEARLPGGRVATAPVVLVDGQTATVELDL